MNGTLKLINMTYEILQTLCALRQQVEAASLLPSLLPLYVCNCQHTHTQATARPIIIFVIHRGAALQQNMKIKIKHALHTKISLDNIFELLFECACAIIIEWKREEIERGEGGSQRDSQVEFAQVAPLCIWQRHSSPR